MYSPRGKKRRNILYYVHLHRYPPRPGAGDPSTGPDPWILSYIVTTACLLRIHAHMSCRKRNLEYRLTHAYMVLERSFFEGQ